MPFFFIQCAHMVPSVGMSPLATVKQYSDANLCAPVHPMHATPSSLAVSWSTRQLSEIIGPRTTTQPWSTSHR